MLEDLNLDQGLASDDGGQPPDEPPQPTPSFPSPETPPKELDEAMIYPSANLFASSSSVNSVRQEFRFNIMSVPKRLSPKHKETQEATERERPKTADKNVQTDARRQPRVRPTGTPDQKNRSRSKNKKERDDKITQTEQVHVVAERSPVPVSAPAHPEHFKRKERPQVEEPDIVEVQKKDLPAHVQKDKEVRVVEKVMERDRASRGRPPKQPLNILSMLVPQPDTESFIERRQRKEALRKAAEALKRENAELQQKAASHLPPESNADTAPSAKFPLKPPYDTVRPAPTSHMEVRPPVSNVQPPEPENFRTKTQRSVETPSFSPADNGPKAAKPEPDKHERVSVRTISPPLQSNQSHQHPRAPEKDKKGRSKQRKEAPANPPFEANQISPVSFAKNSVHSMESNLNNSLQKLSLQLSGARDPAREAQRMQRRMDLSKLNVGLQNSSKAVERHQKMEAEVDRLTEERERKNSSKIRGGRPKVAGNSPESKPPTPSAPSEYFNGITSSLLWETPKATGFRWVLRSNFKQTLKRAVMRMRIICKSAGPSGVICSTGPNSREIEDTVMQVGDTVELEKGTYLGLENKSSEKCEFECQVLK